MAESSNIIAGKLWFLERVRVREGHWVWQGRMSAGVPVTRNAKGKQVPAADIAWALWRGQTRIPEGKRLMLTCDVPLCVAPDHHALK